MIVINKKLMKTFFSNIIQTVLESFFLAVVLAVVLASFLSYLEDVGEFYEKLIFYLFYFSVFLFGVARFFSRFKRSKLSSPSSKPYAE